MEATDLEIRQRATALAPLLDALVHREPDRRARNPAEHDVAWSSSSLVAKWLETASFLKPPLGEEEAAGALPLGRFADLLAKTRVRVVFGRVELQKRDPTNRLGAAERAEIELLRKLSRERERHELWIPADVARATHASHAVGHPQTPSWNDVAKPGLLDQRRRDGIDGYVLPVNHANGHNWLREVLREAAAKLWASLLGIYGSSDVDALHSWLRRIHSLDVMFYAPAHMPLAIRERLLSAALRILETDPNLGDLAREVGAGPDASRVKDMPKAHTCASLHLFWEDQQWEVYDEARTPLFGLVALIARYDSLDEFRPTDCARIAAIAELGREKPHLLYDLALDLRFSRASPIAWLLTRPSTAAFALLLLVNLTLREQTTTDDWEARAARGHERLLLLLRDALPIFCRTLAVAELDDDAKQAVVPAILDVLRGFARDSSSGFLEATPQNIAATARAEEAFRFVASALAGTRPATNVVLAGKPDHVALLLAEIAGSLLEAAPDHLPARELVPRLKVDMEFLRFLREHRSAFAAGPPDRVAQLESVVMSRMHADYLRALETDREGDAFRHFSRDAAFVALPWEYFSCTAFERGTHETWLRLPMLRAKLFVAASGDEHSQQTALAGYAARMRVHVEVLLHAHSGNVAHILAAHDIRSGMKEALESAITELVVGVTDAAKGSVDLFDHELVYSYRDDELPALVETVATALSHFESSRRDRTFAEWIAKTNHPSELLTIEKGANSLSTQRLAGEKLAQRVVLDAVDEGGVLRVFEVVQRAAAAGHDELVARLLARGERVTAGHPWRPLWEQRAFGAQLLLLYKKTDRAGIAGLALPPTARDDTPAGREARRPLEENRRFYLALHDLETDPTAAHTSFAEQLAREPTSSALLLNLFAAKLRVAKVAPDDASRRAAYLEALHWWDQASASAPRPDAVEPLGTVNEFIALQGAELDDEFDRRWARLDELTRSQVDLLGVRIQNLRRRGIQDDADRLVALAKRQHGDAVVAAMEITEAAPATIGARRRSPETYQRYWGEIRVLPAEDISVIFGHPSLQDYLLRVHVNACDHLLRRIETIRALGEENRVNDFVVSFVGMQLGLHDWTAQEQSRGGLANTADAIDDGSPGTRDWIICQGLVEIAICEAMRLDSVEKGKIDEHVRKLIERYNPTGTRASVVVVYFEGADFARFAGAYRDEVARVTLAEATLDASAPFIELGKNRLRAFRVHVVTTDAGRATQDHVLVHLGRPAAHHRRGRRRTAT